MREAEQFFTCEGLCAAYDGAQVLRGIDLEVRDGEIVGVLGPNGSGKSTLLRVLSGALAPSAGRCLLRGRRVESLRPRERARLLAVVQQQTALTFGFPVWDMVAMGRHARLRPLRGLTAEDRQAVRRALERTDCAHLSDRLVTELSGGELQRVIIARALAQEPQALLLDEPTSHLDINHQLESGELLRALNREQGMTIVWVSHDLNLAAEFCGRLVVIGEGLVVADGAPEEVMTAELLTRVYGVRVPVMPNPVTGRPQVVIAAGGDDAR